MLPPIDPTTKLLPAQSDKAPYLATVDEVYETFVAAAPHRERRELIFAAFRIYSQLLWEYLPQASLWLNGGFITHKDAAPHDLDVAFLTPSDEFGKVFAVESDALSLLTFQTFSALQPQVSGLRRLQPFGGLIDSFYVPADYPLVVKTWRDRWSMATTPSGVGYRDDIFKGFVEVRS